MEPQAKLYLFGKYLDFPAKTYRLVLIYPKILIYFLGLYFRPEIIARAATPWWFKSFWKPAFSKLSEDWPNLTLTDKLPASRLGTILSCRYESDYLQKIIVHYSGQIIGQFLSDSFYQTDYREFLILQIISADLVFSISGASGLIAEVESGG